MNRRKFILGAAATAAITPISGICSSRSGLYTGGMTAVGEGADDSGIHRWSELLIMFGWPGGVPTDMGPSTLPVSVTGSPAYPVVDGGYVLNTTGGINYYPTHAGMDELSFTMAIWVKDPSINAWNGLITLTQTADKGPGSIVFNGTSYAFNSPGSTNWGLDGAAVANTWKHLVYVRNGNNVKGYVDGVLAVNVSAIPKLTSYTPRIALGCFYYPSTNRLSGYIGDARIYDAEFTASEVLDLFNDGRPIYT